MSIRCSREGDAAHLDYGLDSGESHPRGDLPPGALGLLQERLADMLVTLTYTPVTGDRFLLRPVLPVDRGRIRDAFARTSDQTRIARFFTHRTGLSDRELTYFTCVDQIDHVAWGALAEHEAGEPGVAVARYIRDRHRPGWAEFAVMVVDEYQGLGLGTALLGLLATIASENGIHTFWGQVLPENGRAQAWFRHLGANVVPLGEVCYFQLPTREAAERLGRMISRPIDD